MAGGSAKGGITGDGVAIPEALCAPINVKTSIRMETTKGRNIPAVKFYMNN